MPGEFVWLDLVIPASDVLWADDIAAAMLWVGELWQRALGDLRVATAVSIESVPSPWSRQVCFAGVGSGEVVFNDRKFVGVSQRRTRAGARFQSLCHLRWRPELVAALVASPRPLAADLAACVATVAAPMDAIRDALVRNLPAS